LSTPTARKWLSRWIQYFGITSPVVLARISHFSVVGERGRPPEGLVGISKDSTGVWVLYHTRKLKESDIVHELLHVRYPRLSEADVVELTDHLLNAQRKGHLKCTTG